MLWNEEDRNEPERDEGRPPGVVVGGRVIVQLALVKLDHDRREIAVPVDELLDPDNCPRPDAASVEADPLRGMPESKTLEDASKETEPGDRVMIQLEEVQRINHAGAVVVVPLSRASLTFGFTIS